MISGSVENLLLSRRSVVGVRWVGGGPVVELLVGGLVEHLLLDWWSVVGGRLLVGNPWFCNMSIYLCNNFMC